MSKKGGYSSQSYSPAGSGKGSAKSYPSVPRTNPDLLNPAGPKVDPQDQSAKTKEKDQMVGLNDKFVAFIDKVQHLEEQNKVLDAKLKILQDQDNYKGNVDDIVNQLRNDLQRQIDGLDRDHQKLKQELARAQDEVEHTREQYDDEFQKKSDAENEFVLSKKDVDEGHLAAVDLALELEDLMGELDFLRRGFEEEIKELQSQIVNEKVVVKGFKNRNLDMEQIVNDMKEQYARMASKTRDEAEQWNQRKMEDMETKAGLYQQNVRDVKKDISDQLRLIQKLNQDLESLRKKKEGVEKDIEDTELEGQKALEQAREHLVLLEDALRRAKQDMARQVREYQELMNLKLALDIEIATYRKLLEGEEKRMREHQQQQDY